jgi:hypothetical protein
VQALTTGFPSGTPTDLPFQSTSTNVLGLLGPGIYGSQARITLADRVGGQQEIIDAQEERIAKPDDLGTSAGLTSVKMKSRNMIFSNFKISPRHRRS